MNMLRMTEVEVNEEEAPREEDKTRKIALRNIPDCRVIVNGVVATEHSSTM